MKLCELLDCCADVQVKVFDGSGRKLFVYDVDGYAENSDPANYAAYFLYKDMEVKEIHAEHEKEYSLPFINAVLVDECGKEYQDYFTRSFDIAYRYMESAEWETGSDDLAFIVGLFSRSNCAAPKAAADFLVSLF